MTDRELMQQALDAMLNFPNDISDDMFESIRSLRARLAQPEQQPEQELVAWLDAPMKIYLQVCDDDVCEVPFSEHDEVSWCKDKINGSDVAYIRADTAPPQREWQGLTTQEIADETDIATSSNKDIFDFRKAFWCGARWAEAKLKGKNAL